MFYVWRRSDNYVDASTSMPEGWKTASGEIISFILLKTFKEWNSETVDFIENERLK